MTEQEIEKLQRGIEAALRDMQALDFGATIRKGNGQATVVLRPKSGYDVEGEQREQEKIADQLRIALMGRGYNVTSEVIPPSRKGESYSFTIRGR